MSPYKASSFGLQPGVARKLVAWGLIVWFGVVVFVRLAGHMLLDPLDPTIVAAFFVLVIPLMALVTYPIYWQLAIEPSGRPAAAGMMSIPGMILDVGLVMTAD